MCLIVYIYSWGIDLKLYENYDEIGGVRCLCNWLQIIFENTCSLFFLFLFVLGNRVCLEHEGSFYYKLTVGITELQRQYEVQYSW
jgi:hypothetical protein